MKFYIYLCYVRIIPIFFIKTYKKTDWCFEVFSHLINISVHISVFVLYATSSFWSIPMETNVFDVYCADVNNDEFIFYS